MKSEKKLKDLELKSTNTVSAFEAQEAIIAKLEKDLDLVHNDFNNLDQLLQSNQNALRNITLERNQLIEGIAKFENESLVEREKNRQKKEEYKKKLKDYEDALIKKDDKINQLKAE